MYLRAGKYLPGWRDDGGGSEYHQLAARFGVLEFLTPHARSATIKFTVAYWRKANAVHDWFVREVQNGEDECREHHVLREDLENLIALCQGVLDEPDRESAARESLPPRAGFFFGSTAVDEWYEQDLQVTIDQLTKVLKMPSEWDFYYQSSW
jgi:hypothetical protein